MGKHIFWRIQNLFRDQAISLDFGSGGPCDQTPSTGSPPLGMTNSLNEPTTS
jgi:hypothetical protein